MNKETYRKARRLVRDNGRQELRWLDEIDRLAMDRLLTVQDSADPLAERQSIVRYCLVEGLSCNVRHTGGFIYQPARIPS